MKQSTLSLTACLCLTLMIACTPSAPNTENARAPVTPSPLPTSSPSPTRPTASPKSTATPLTRSTPSDYSNAPSNLGVTLAAYNALHEGMSYSEAVRILGSSGTELSSGGAESGYATVMYQWKASSGVGNMTAMFQNGRLINKAQFGLQ